MLDFPWEFRFWNAHVTAIVGHLWQCAKAGTRRKPEPADDPPREEGDVDVPLLADSPVQDGDSLRPTTPDTLLLPGSPCPESSSSLEQPTPCFSVLRLDCACVETDPSPPRRQETEHDGFQAHATDSQVLDGDDLDRLCALVQALPSPPRRQPPEENELDFQEAFREDCLVQRCPEERERDVQEVEDFETVPPETCRVQRCPEGTAQAVALSPTPSDRPDPENAPSVQGDVLPDEAVVVGGARSGKQLRANRRLKRQREKKKAAKLADYLRRLAADAEKPEPSPGNQCAVETEADVAEAVDRETGGQTRED